MIEVGDVKSLENGSKGLVFSVELKDADQDNSTVPAFAIRFNDEIFVYKNICGHIAVNLDFMPGQFFDDEGQHLVCATHGALYEANTGKCLGGPCYGVGLEKLNHIIQDNILYITDETIVAVNR